MGSWPIAWIGKGGQAYDEPFGHRRSVAAVAIGHVGWATHRRTDYQAAPSTAHRSRGPPTIRSSSQRPCHAAMDECTARRRWRTAGIFHSSHHSEFVPQSALATFHSPLSRRRLAVLVFDGIVEFGTCVAGRLDMEDFCRSRDSASRLVAGGARRNSESPIPTVGRITGVVECRWADSENAAFDGDSVSLGRKLALASGFLEITYDTGAKVILHGPCRYEAESSRGGFLSLGRLTARVEAKKGTGPIGRNGPSPASGYPACAPIGPVPFFAAGFRGEGRANR